MKTFMSADDLVDEIKDILSKIKECEKNATQREVETQPKGGSPFYGGQATAYRNSAHYLENLLKIAVKE